MATDWLSRLNSDPTEWLREHPDPMIRYRTLTWIQERPTTDPAVREAREAAARHPRLGRLLAGQSRTGAWENPDLAVDDYYYGTAWRLILAAHLGAERTEEIARGVEFLFTTAQSRDGGGFSHVASPRRGGTIGGQWACLTGAVVEMLLHFGYGNDPRTQRAIGFLVSRQQGDGLYPCENFSPNAGTLPFNCFMGSVKPLLAVAAIPPRRRNPQVRALIEKTANTLLAFGLYRYKRTPDGRRAPKEEWLQFGFPRFWNTDLLEVAWVLARLGYGHEAAMEPALDVILGKQLKNGRWRLDFDYNDRMPIRMEKRNVSSPWITLRALHTLKLASAIAQLEPV